MIVHLNSTPVDIPAGTTLASLLQLRSITTAGIATAVNGTVVPATARPSTILRDGDQITVIRAFYGG